jgi:CelD/BcsL family acetyltransferase involved in cellulose biosynthesis
MHGFVRRIDALSAEQIRQWNSLLAGSLNRSPFLTHEWSLAVHKQRGGVYVAALLAGGKIAGYLPFQMKCRRHWLGHAEKVGGRMSDCFDIIGRTESLSANWNLLRLANLSALRVDHAPLALGSLFSDVEYSLGIRIVIDDFPAYMGELARADKKFTASVRRGERQLASQIGEVRFAWNVADPFPELDRLIVEKREQYRRTNVQDGLAAAWKRGLLRDLFAQPSELKPVLSTLYCGPAWLATCLSLAYKDVFHIWFPAYNHAYRRFSPGHVLFFKLFEHATNEGYRIFDFGEGAAQYKRRYGGEEYAVFKGALRSRGLRGFSEKVIEGIYWRAKRLSNRARIADKLVDSSSAQNVD